MADRPEPNSVFEQELSRRRFFESALRGGAGVALGAGALGGLASARDAFGASFAQAPRKGGTLIYDDQSTPSGFDPNKWWNAASETCAFACFDRLLDSDERGNLVASLASLPTVSNGGTVYHFKLRPGVKFHNGQPLTADDVKFSLERLIGPALASEAGSLYTAIPIRGMADVQSKKTTSLSGIEVIDPLNLTITLDRPDSTLSYVLSAPFASIVPQSVVQKVGDAAFNFAPVGTGPFIAKSASPTNGVTLVRNPSYWRPGVPYLDGVNWSVGVDDNLAALRIERGEADLMSHELSGGTLAQVRSNPTYAKQLQIAQTNDCFYITLSLRHPALKKLKVRQAIAMAINKERIVRELGGLALAANGGIFSPVSPYYQHNLSYPYNPKKAKKLLAEAGYPHGFDVQYYGTIITPYKEIGPPLEQDLAQIGIRMKLNALSVNAWLAAIVKYPAGITENHENLLYPHGSYVMDPSFTSQALSLGCCNASYYKSAAMDKLAREGHAATSKAKQVAIYKKMDRIAIRQLALWVPIFYPKWAQFYSARLRGYTVPIGDAEPKHFADYWLAS